MATSGGRVRARDVTSTLGAITLTATRCPYRKVNAARVATTFGGGDRAPAVWVERGCALPVQRDWATTSIATT